MNVDETSFHPPMNELIENLLKLQSLTSDKTAAAGMGKQIEALRSNVPAPVLLHYDRLVARGKKGLAGVRNQVCTGCHMQVSRNTVMTLMRGDDLQICEACGRYLYLLPELPAAAVVKKTVPAKKRKSQKESGVLVHVA
jgi:hypothetical protein